MPHLIIGGKYMSKAVVWSSANMDGETAPEKDAFVNGTGDTGMDEQLPALKAAGKHYAKRFADGFT